MAQQSAVAQSATDRDPIADARALVAMAVTLGTRARNAHRLGQVTDRKASLYVNTLVRHAARLLQSTDNHDVPILHASTYGPGGNSVHYVIRHDQLDGPPMAQRFVTVGSDARLRCCVVSMHDGSRIWADYDVASAPDDLPLRVVLDSLSELISRLERAVTRLEAKQLARETQLEADIAIAKSRLSGMTPEGTGPKRHATSEEPIRPWTRHVPGAPAAVKAAAAVPATPAVAAAEAVTVAAAPATATVAAAEPAGAIATVAEAVQATGATTASDAVPPTTVVSDAEPTEVTEPEAPDLFGGTTIDQADTISNTTSGGDAPTSDARPRRSFKLSRLGNAI